LLRDFDHVLTALYAENNDVSISYRQSSIANPGVYVTPPPAKIDRVKSIWATLLPHRELVVLGGNLKTRTKNSYEYSACEMSDGERVIFYLIAQTLLAKADTVLIFDEPELHINKSILAKLWDSIESARPDCAFLYITHDVEFASSRHAATKYALHAFELYPNQTWDIELLPDKLTNKKYLTTSWLPSLAASGRCCSSRAMGGVSILLSIAGCIVTSP